MNTVFGIRIKLDCQKNKTEFERGKSMEIDIETLIGGIFCLGYVVYGPLVKGGFWRQNWTNKGGRWVSATEGPIFFVLMILLFFTLGIVLTLEGLRII